MTDIYPEVNPLTGEFVNGAVHERYTRNEAAAAATAQAAQSAAVDAAQSAADAQAAAGLVDAPAGEVIAAALAPGGAARPELESAMATAVDWQAAINILEGT